MTVWTRCSQPVTVAQFWYNTPWWDPSFLRQQAVWFENCGNASLNLMSLILNLILALLFSFPLWWQKGKRKEWQLSNKSRNICCQSVATQHSHKLKGTVAGSDTKVCHCGYYRHFEKNTLIHESGINRFISFYKVFFSPKRRTIPVFCSKILSEVHNSEPITLIKQEMCVPACLTNGVIIIIISHIRNELLL